MASANAEAILFVFMLMRVPPSMNMVMMPCSSMIMSFRTGSILSNSTTRLTVMSAASLL